jgi:ubiquinone/menaquinone biosynthesis C-methylase UbiE
MSQACVQVHFGRLAEQGVWASLYGPRDRVTSETWTFLIRARRVLELMRSLDRPVADVLDVGCGTAPLARSLVALGSTYTGVDFSPAMINSAREHLADLTETGAARLEVGDATALGYADEGFDAVISMGVLEYLDLSRVRQALCETVRVLRPRGVAILTIPKRWHWGRLIQRLGSPLRRIVRARPRAGLKLEGREEFQRLLLTPGELDQACRDAGLRKIDQRHYNVQPICRPATVLAPRMSYLLNRPFEGVSRAPGGRFLATGYIGMYEKNQRSQKSV